MKLRQKLAMVLAAAMVVTAVPVVTFAASTNTIVNKQIGKKDRVYGNRATAPILKIKLEDDVDTTVNDGLFYITATGFEFDQAFYNNEPGEIYTSLDAAQGAAGDAFGDIEVVTGKKQLMIDISGYGAQEIPENTILYIPLLGKVTGDSASLTIDSCGLEITGIDDAGENGKAIVFAESKDQNMTITTDDVTNIYDEGAIGDLVFEESYAGIVASKADKAEDGFFEVKLSTDNQDFEFYDRNQSVKLYLTKGFGKNTSTDFYTIGISSKYGDEITFKIPVSYFKDADGSWTDSKGAFRIEDLEMRANTKTPTAGDLKINVKGDLGEATGLKVANIVSTDTKIYMKDEKTLDIVAGQSKEDAVFFLEENIKDGILPNHSVDFELSKGYFGQYDEAKYGDIKKATRSQKVASAEEIIKSKDEDVDIIDVKMDGKKFIGFTAKFNAVDNNDDGDYTDHTADINAAPLDSKDKYEFEAPICVDLDTADATEIKLTASAERSIDEEVSTIAAKVKAPVKVTADAMVVKVGLQDQKYAGKVVITETDKDMIKRGDLVISTPAEGYKFTEKGDVKVTAGDLVIKSWDIKDDRIVIEVKNASKTASTIEITGFEVQLDRTVPEGTYKIEVAGNSLSSEHDKDGAHNHGAIKVEDFFKVNTPNEEDLKNGALKAVIAKFTADSKEYVVDGVNKTMDASAYIQDDRIMVPVRYVAEAFGISTQNVLFSNGVATIIAGEKIVQVKVGSDVITVNGMAMKMDTKAVVKEGRTYLPLKFIAVALGVESSYDSATKTATFSNRDAK